MCLSPLAELAPANCLETTPVRSRYVLPPFVLLSVESRDGYVHNADKGELLLVGQHHHKGQACDVVQRKMYFFVPDITELPFLSIARAGIV